MTLTEYKKQAIRTMKPDMIIEDVYFGIIGEFGEMVDVLKKMIFHKTNGIEDKLKKEIGDLFWYIIVYAEMKKIEITDNLAIISNDTIIDIILETQFKITSIIHGRKVNDNVNGIVLYLIAICNMYNFNYEEILDINILKLKTRYPELYTHELSEKRIDANEK